MRNMLSYSNKPNIHKVGKWILYIFVTMIIANGISYIPFVSEISKIGKLIILGIGLILLSSIQRFNLFFSQNKLLILFGIISFIFSLTSFFESNIDNTLLLTNITFLPYIYFFFLISSSIWFEANYKKSSLHILISRHLANILNFNFIFWTIITLSLGIPLWQKLDDRNGLSIFYNSYIQLGIFATCGSIVHFTLIKFDKKTLKNKIWLLTYIIIVILSNSRNAQLIVILSGILLNAKFIYQLLIKLKWLFLGFIIFIILFSGSIQSFLLNEETLKITTGRSTIWSFVLLHYEENSIFQGNGIFGLNNSILNENKSANYYFDRIDFLYFHNSYIEYFAAAGIIGLLIIILYFLIHLKRSKTNSINPILISVLAGAFFESFLIQPIIPITSLFWLYLFVNQLIYITQKSQLAPYEI